MNTFKIAELQEQVTKLFAEESIYRQELVVLNIRPFKKQGIEVLGVTLGETVYCEICDEDCHALFIWTRVPEGVPYMFRTVPELTEEIVQEAIQDGFINIVLSRDLELPEKQPKLRLVSSK